MFHLFYKYIIFHQSYCKIRFLYIFYVYMYKKTLLSTKSRENYAAWSTLFINFIFIFYLHYNFKDNI